MVAPLQTAKARGPETNPMPGVYESSDREPAPSQPAPGESDTSAATWIRGVNSPLSFCVVANVVGNECKRPDDGFDKSLGCTHTPTPTHTHIIRHKSLNARNWKMKNYFSPTMKLTQGLGVRAPPTGKTD